MDNRNKKLANNLIHNSIFLNKNDNLLVEVIGEDGLELANEIMKQARKLDAKPHLNIINYENLRINSMGRKKFKGIYCYTRKYV